VRHHGEGGGGLNEATNRVVDVRTGEPFDE
jgi:hypothetical protein